MQGGVKIFFKKFHYSSVVTWDGLEMQKQANWPHGRSAFHSEGTKKQQRVLGPVYEGEKRFLAKHAQFKRS